MSDLCLKHQNPKTTCPLCEELRQRYPDPPSEPKGWLRTRAELAALEIPGGFTTAGSEGFEGTVAEIMSVAREFADRALQHVIWHGRANSGQYMAGATIPMRNGLFGLGYGTGPNGAKQAEEHAEWAIAKCIEEADRE